jgi:hypothetical protein
MLHLFVAQLKVEDVEVALEVILAPRFGNGSDMILLYQPAQCHLRGRLAVGLPDLLEYAVVEYGLRTMGLQAVSR